MYEPFAQTKILLLTVGICMVIVIGALIYILMKKFKMKDIPNEDKIEEMPNSRSDLVNSTGMTLNDLRPTGFAMIGEEKVEVTTSGKMIRKNTPIRVIGVEGQKIIVEKLEGVW